MFYGCYVVDLYSISGVAVGAAAASMLICSFVRTLKFQAVSPPLIVDERVKISYEFIRFWCINLMTFYTVFTSLLTFVGMFIVPHSCS